jgi:hypothetical protein
MMTSYIMPEAHAYGTMAASQVPTLRQIASYWSTFAGTVALITMLVFWWLYEPDQDHLGSISLNGDGSWFHNYEVNFEIQDQEILFFGIGRSIENAQQADIIFLGPSTVLFGIDWRLFEEFERKHHIKMFNMGLAGIVSGEFSLRVIRKWGLHPKLWIIHADMHDGNLGNSFFYMSLPAGPPFNAGSPGRVVNATWMRAFRSVVGRNIRWRMKMMMGFLQRDPYRSAKTGNWYLDNWPFQMNNNATIQSWVGRTCPENPGEAELAKRYLQAIGGETLLIQVPSVLSCAQRIHNLASAVGVRSFTVDPEPFTSGDGGGHLDRSGSRKYTALFFAWLEQIPEFKRLIAR